MRKIIVCIKVTNNIMLKLPLTSVRVVYLPYTLGLVWSAFEASG